MKNKGLVLILIALLLVLIGFVLMRQKAQAPALEGNQTTTAIAIEQPMDEWDRVNGGGEKIGEPELTQVWHGLNGIEAQLYTQHMEREPGDDTDYSNDQYSMSIKKSSGERVQIKGFWPSYSVLGVHFSPQGTYITVEMGGWESRTAYTSRTSDGFALMELQGKIPYWNEDESMLAIVQYPASIDGQPAEIYISSTGLPKDAEIQLKLPAADWVLEEVTKEGDILTLPFVHLGRSGQRDLSLPYKIDLDMGSFGYW